MGLSPLQYAFKSTARALEFITYKSSLKASPVKSNVKGYSITVSNAEEQESWFHALGTMKPSTSMSETGASASYMSSSSSGSSGASPRRAALEELRLAFPTLPELNLHHTKSPHQDMMPLSVLWEHTFEVTWL